MIDEYLLLRRSEPDCRAVLEDSLLEQGRRLIDHLDDEFFDGGGGGGDGGDGDGYGDGEYSRANEEFTMREGLKILSIGGGYYVYLLVGWAKRREGDEWDLLGARCIRRQGSGVSLATLATKGPQPGTELLNAADEEIHRLKVRRALNANEKAWAKDCPRPEGFLTTEEKEARYRKEMAR